MNYQMLQQ